MNLQPYTGHKAPAHLTYPKNPTELDRLIYRLRAWGEDDSGLMIDAADTLKVMITKERDAADMLKTITSERDAADARVKILEAENIALRALAQEQVA